MRPLPAAALIFAVAACGCEDAPAPIAPPASASPSSGPTTTPASSLHDDFESESLAPFWRSGDYGAARYVPGAVALTRDIARSGRAAVRITLHEGQVRQVGDDGLETERAELDSGSHAVLGRDVWYGYSFLVPQGFPVVDNRLVISQWKQTGLQGSPLVAVRFRDGRHDVTFRRSGRRFRLPPIEFERWNDVVCRTRFSRGDDGLVEMWVNGKLVVSHKGANCFPGGEDAVYHKLGLYRDRWKEPMTIYFDNYAMGESRDAVDPARFDARR